MLDQTNDQVATSNRTIKKTGLGKEQRVLEEMLEAKQDLYSRSELKIHIEHHLRTVLNSKAPIRQILSLGLGTFTVAKSLARRIKQLVILLAIRRSFQHSSKSEIDLYAQDPSFTRSDEAFLNSLGIKILRTSSASELGQAASIIGPSTLVYSPFLTIDVYEQLFAYEGAQLPCLFADDFNALVKKWPRHSREQKQVEGLVKKGLSKYRRRGIVGEGFWVDEDETFPMAMYEVQGEGKSRAYRAKI